MALYDVFDLFIYTEPFFCPFTGRMRMGKTVHLEKRYVYPCIVPVIKIKVMEKRSGHQIFCIYMLLSSQLKTEPCHVYGVGIESDPSVCLERFEFFIIFVGKNGSGIFIKKCFFALIQSDHAAILNARSGFCNRFFH